MMGRLSRHTATPDVAVIIDRIWSETDIRAILPSVSAPALLLAYDGRGDYVASICRTPRFDRSRIHGATEASTYASGSVSPRRSPFSRAFDRALHRHRWLHRAARRARDATWRSILARHDERARIEIDAPGPFIDSAGDGIFATFDGPALGGAVSLAIMRSVEDLGIQIRAGVHTGEVELDGDPYAVSRCTSGPGCPRSRTPPGIVSQTVKDLVAGSGLVFEDAGEHELKGVPGVCSFTASCRNSRYPIGRKRHLQVERLVDRPVPCSSAGRDDGHRMPSLAA